MIVVVEGPSAAGKTTWITRHADPATVVPELTAREATEAPAHPRVAAEFWAAVNSARWRRATHLEQAHGVAVCDTDPLKLHYAWAMWRTGHASQAAWRAAVEACRQAFELGRLGIADLILVTIPEASTIDRHRRHDPTRRRRHFDLHRQLRAPLAEWYRAVDQLDPGRVVWELPQHGLPEHVRRREPNTGAELFDALMKELPDT